MKGYSTQHVLLFVVVVLLWACNEERDQVTLTYYMPAPPSDAGQRVFPEPTPEPELTPPTDQCDENAIRCLASHSDRIEACRLSEDGETTRWIQDRCSPGFVCVDNACTTFSCIPERPTCDGLYTRGVCNAEGDALIDPTPCEGDEVCRGGSCIDLCASAEQTRSYIGCEYMAVELPNPELELDEPFGLVVANTDPLLDAVLTVYGHNGEPSELIDTVTITRNRGREDEERVESHIEDASGEIVPIDKTRADAIVLPPQAVATLLFPRRGSVNNASGVYAAERGFTRRLVSSRPVVAYQFNPYCCNFSYTNDASLLLPVYALGDRYTPIVPPDWIVPNSGNNGNPPRVLSGGVVLVAHDDGTELSFTFPAQARLVGGLSSSENPLPTGPTEVDQPYTWDTTLEAGDMLYLQSRTTNDRRSWLTGVHVQGNKTFATFSTHECTNIPHQLAACDHLETQVVPDDTWGRRYVLAPFARRSLAPSEIMYWHLLSGSNGATITLGAPLELSRTLAPFSSGANNCLERLDRDETRRILILEPGTDCILATQDPVMATSSDPIAVVGYISGEKSSEAPCGDRVYCNSGDPAMFMMPPIEQFRSSYVFLAPETYLFDFMTLVVPASATTSMTLDGEPLDLTNSNVDAFNVLGSEFVVAHVPVRDGAHRIESVAPFGLLVYAYDQYVSYAYPGGLNLTKRP